MDLIKDIKKYQKQIIAGFVSITLLVGGIYGYVYYKHAKEESAYRAFSQALEYLERPVRKGGDTEGDRQDSFIDVMKHEFKSEEEKWAKIDSEFKQAYEKNRGAGIAPIFLTYRAEALIQLGRFDEATKVLRLASSQIKNKPILDYYKSKLALLLIDSKKSDLIKEGVGILEKISLDDKSVANDVALYHLGQYYWGLKKYNEAKNYWNQLLLKFGTEANYPSPFVGEAKKKLKLIDFDVE